MFRQKKACYLAKLKELLEAQSVPAARQGMAVPAGS
jgi:hypothetical protein